MAKMHTISAPGGKCDTLKKKRYQYIRFLLHICSSLKETLGRYNGIRRGLTLALILEEGPVFFIWANARPAFLGKVGWAFAPFVNPLVSNILYFDSNNEYIRNPRRVGRVDAEHGNRKP